jgi:hypothetical protein
MLEKQPMKFAELGGNTIIFSCTPPNSFSDGNTGNNVIIPTQSMRLLVVIGYNIPFFLAE